MENSSWNNHVKNEGILNTVKEKWNILHTTEQTKANWMGQNLYRNCSPKDFTEEYI
jgi:hypothetical protein